MKNDIITKNINRSQFNELRDFMQNCIEESINALRGISNEYYAEHLVWYEDCEMEDYFVEWTEIWDDDENKEVGKGLNTIAHYFVLNDENRADFESAFEEARDAAFEEAIKELAEEIEDYETDEEMRIIEIDDSVSEDEQASIDNDIYTHSEAVASHINDAVSKLEKDGYKQVFFDSNSDSDLNNNVLYKVYDEYSIELRKIARWFGATVCLYYQGSTDDFDYQYQYFKKNQ